MQSHVCYHVFHMSLCMKTCRIQPLVLMYAGVIRFLYSCSPTHAKYIFTQQNVCYISKSTMKRQSKSRLY